MENKKRFKHIKRIEHREFADTIYKVYFRSKGILCINTSFNGETKIILLKP